MTDLGALSGSRERSHSAVSPPIGFDPERDGFPMSRLLMVASNLATEAAKETAELAYGSWNPLCMSKDASREALNFFAALKRHIEFYERQAAIAIEAASAGETVQQGSTEGESAVAKPDAQNTSEPHHD